MNAAKTPPFTTGPKIRQSKPQFAHVATPEPIGAAAQRLGISRKRLEGLVRKGAPVARKGTRGRGHAALIDADAVRAWRAASSGEKVILELWADLPQVWAKAIADAHRQAEGVNKARLAGVLAASYYTISAATFDYLRGRCASVSEPVDLPPEIAHLRKISQ